MNPSTLTEPTHDEQPAVKDCAPKVRISKDKKDARALAKLSGMEVMHLTEFAGLAEVGKQIMKVNPIYYGAGILAFTRGQLKEATEITLEAMREEEDVEMMSRIAEVHAKQCSILQENGVLHVKLRDIKIDDGSGKPKAPQAPPPGTVAVPMPPPGHSTTISSAIPQKVIDAS